MTRRMYTALSGLVFFAKVPLSHVIWGDPWQAAKIEGVIKSWRRAACQAFDEYKDGVSD